MARRFHSPPQDARKRHDRPRSRHEVDHSIVCTASRLYPLPTFRSDNAGYVTGDLLDFTGVSLYSTRSFSDRGRDTMAAPMVERSGPSPNASSPHYVEYGSSRVRVALPLGVLLLGGRPAGRLCHPGTDQAPQGQASSSLRRSITACRCSRARAGSVVGMAGMEGWSGIGGAHAWLRRGSAAMTRSRRGIWRPASRTLAQVTLPHAAK